ncbi:MAG: polysaccharide biosynthesis C-terminal domain-containing protein [Bacteroidales bacterium]|nr:polysaccharide biosynthesis C-terminal domain-containing protein [Bacteroidales bacterium]
MHPIKKLAGETVIYGLSSIIGRLLNWLLVPLYVRLFVPEVYGIVTNMYAYVAFLIVILTYGMETGYFRYSNKDNDNKKVYTTALLSLFVTSFIFIFLCINLADNIAVLIKYPKHSEYIVWLAVTVGIDAFSCIPFAKLRKENRPVRFATIKFINIGLNIGFNLFFLILCRNIYTGNPNSVIKYIYSPEIGVGYVFISNLIASAITLLLLSPDIFSYKIVFDFKIWKKMLVYSFPLLIVGIAGMTNQNIDKILLRYLLPAAANPMRQLGIYGANYKIAILMAMFIQAFRYSFEPFFFSYSDKTDSKKIYSQIMKYFIIIGLIIFLGITLYIDIVKLFIKENYYSGLRVVPIVLLAIFFQGIFYNLSLWYKLNDLTKYGAYLSIIGAIITIVINIVFIPEYGYMASAWAVLICFVTMTVLSYFLGQKHYPVDYNIKSFFFYLILALGIFFINYNLEFSVLLNKLLFNTLLFFVFLIVVFVKEKPKNFISVIKDRFRK